MKRLTLSICLALALVILAPQAHASEYQDMDICLGKAIIGRLLCKDPNEISYVAKVRDNINLFSVFYAKKETRFFVGVYSDMIRVQGKEFHTVTRSISYNFDKTAKCSVVDFTTGDCPNKDRIVCCSDKTVEEKLDDTFWNRPIPELLEEDLRNAIQGQNATEPAPAPDQTPAQ